MKTTLKKNSDFPVSQNQLAAYLGIKPNVLSMANSGKYGRKLPTGMTLKLAEMVKDFELMKTQPDPVGISWLRINEAENNACTKKNTWLLKEAKYLLDGAEILETKFDKMCKLYERDLRWLNVIDARLTASPTQKEKIWLSYQHSITTKRIEKNGKLAQLELQLKIDMNRSRASVYNKLRDTLT